MNNKLMEKKVGFETFKLKLRLTSSSGSEGAYTTSIAIILFITLCNDLME
jgi:hypothetical protein